MQFVDQIIISLMSKIYSVHIFNVKNLYYSVSCQFFYLSNLYLIQLFIYNKYTKFQIDDAVFIYNGNSVYSYSKP